MNKNQTMAMEIRNEQHIESLHVINAILILSLADSSIEEILQEALDLILSTSSFSFFSCGAIFLVEDNPDLLILKAQKKLSAHIIEKCNQIPFGECLCGKAAYEKKTKHSDTFLCTENKSYLEINGEGNLCVPLIFSDTMQGVINIALNSNIITKEATDFLTSVANIISEIVRRKKTEEQKNNLIKKLELTNEDLKNFAYIVSHDLKAPLRAISILSEWILSDYSEKFDEDGKERVNMLIGRSRKMQSMIDSILQYSRIGHLEEKIEDVDLNVLVMDIIDMLALNSTIVIKIRNKLPVIRCEETLLRQVFHNLIENAVKFNGKSEGKIKIGCMDKGIFWKFFINDNGPGIEKRHYKRIFNMFQTLIPKDESECTGIGLTIAKRIIDLYGGKMWVKSKVGFKSTFFFTIPKNQIKQDNP